MYKETVWTEPNLIKAEVLFDGLHTRHFQEYCAKPKHFNVKARSIGNDIYDIGPFFSGYMSRQAITNKLEYKINPVSEHFHSRQKSGHILLTCFLREPNITFTDFLYMLEPFCRVHKTTKEENIKLCEFQSLQTHWTEDYKNAGIELVHVGTDRMLTKKYLSQFI